MALTTMNRILVLLACLLLVGPVYGGTISSEGVTYVGEVRNGQPHGQGTLTWASGAEYVGEFKDGKMHGQGIFTFPDGSQFIGKYQNNKGNGQGTLLKVDGTKYVGEWKDGKPHGQGTTTYPSGRIFYSGEWVNGNPTDKQLNSFEVPDAKKIDWRSMAELDESQLKAINCFFEGIEVLEHWQEAERMISGDPDFVALHEKFYIEAVDINEVVEEWESLDVSGWLNDPPFQPIDFVEAFKIRIENEIPSISPRHLEVLTRIVIKGMASEMLTDKRVAEELSITTNLDRTSITEFPNESEQELLRRYFCLTDKTWEPTASLVMRCNLLGLSKELAEWDHSWIEMSVSAHTSLMIDLINGRITFGEYQSELNKTEGWVQTSLASIGDTTYLEWQTSLRNSLVRRGLIDSNDQPAAKRTFSCPDD
jgi:hypothetical protein